MTPLDLWPELAARYVQAPRPTTPWHYASIQEAHDKMSPWNFFFYALVAYANALVEWIQHMNTRSAVPGTQAAAQAAASLPEFARTLKSRDSLAKRLQAERPRQDPFFLEKVLNKNRKEILDVHSWGLLIGAEEKVLRVVRELLPDAKTLLDDLYTLTKKITSIQEQNKNKQNQGYDDLFNMDSEALRARMLLNSTWDVFRASYPKLSEEEQVAETLSEDDEMRHRILSLQALLIRLFKEKANPEYFAKLKSTAWNLA
jgi:hypothetical protein